jgi:hypothetical protein
MQISYNIKGLEKLLKLLPFGILVFILYDLIIENKLLFSWDFLYEMDWSFRRLALFIPVVLLMLLNWLLEAKKWQLLTYSYFPLSIKKSFISVLSGISTALFTPNRLGDFIGRFSHLPKKDKKKGVLSSIYGSYSQWLLTIIMGCLAWIQLGNQFVSNSKLYYSISIGYIAGIVVLLFLFMGNGKWIHSFKRLQKYKAFQPSKKIRISIILLSLFRYFVFTTQFYILLQILGVDLSYALVLSKLGLFYLLTSLVPSTFWGEIGVKESVAVWVFSGLIINSLIIVCATLLIWLINLIIPALIGNYFLYKELARSN